MSIFIKKNDKMTELDNTNFEKENDLQELLYQYPEIIFNYSELGLDKEEVVVKYREYSTSRGPIDNLYITRNGEIIVVETKLIKNPEAIRTVIAQIVDYIKALTIDGYKDIYNKNCEKMEIINDFIPDDRFLSLLNNNFSTGSINGIIIGDDIHPNLLGLVESIQSAPHLGFHLTLLKIEVYKNIVEDIIIVKSVESTKEIERSVIKITFDPEKNKHIIESETPSKTGKGTRPILTWEQYLNLVDTKYQIVIDKFKKEWVKIFGESSIKMNTASFTGNCLVENKKQTVLYLYYDKVELITEAFKNSLKISDKTYLIYKNELKKSPDIYDKYLIGGKKDVYFDNIDTNSLENILKATILLTEEWQKEFKI